jgi:hypothetical protein
MSCDHCQNVHRKWRKRSPMHIWPDHCHPFPQVTQHYLLRNMFARRAHSWVTISKSTFDSRQRRKEFSFQHHGLKCPAAQPVRHVVGCTYRLSAKDHFPPAGTEQDHLCFLCSPMVKMPTLWISQFLVDLKDGSKLVFHWTVYYIKHVTDHLLGAMTHGSGLTCCNYARP